MNSEQIIYTIIYQSANVGTRTYERKSLRGAVNFAKKLMERDNARSVMVERTQWSEDGSLTNHVYSDAR